MVILERVSRVFGLICAFAVVWPASAANTTAKLILSRETARPGETVWAGVALHMNSGWHTYWQNPGDSGAPTTIAWTLPAGVTAGPVQWPVPEKDVSGGLTTYVYRHDVVLLVPLTLAGTVASGALEISAKVSWLECEQACIPGRASVATQLGVGSEAKPSKDAPVIEEWKTKLPQPRPGSFANSWWAGPAKGDVRPVFIEWAPAKDTKETDFYPLPAKEFAVKPATEIVSAGGGKVRLRKEVEKVNAWPRVIAGVLIERAAKGVVAGAYEVAMSIGSSATSTSREAETISSGDAHTSTAGAGDVGGQKLLLYLGLAFLGGLVLNLMPCVLPVIALKILSFVNQGSGSAAQSRKLGLLYGAGVLASLLALSGLVIGIQKAGGAAGWGIQFQNPQFIVGITVLITLVALNLFGVFEVTLGGGTMGAAGELASREGGAGAFFNGVLAVVLATPCTAPFMGVALGYAFTQPPGTVILIFAALAIGLACPYVLLSFFPALLRFLPRPGVWMERFKVAMGFPMLATALWLLTLTVPHYGTEGMLFVGLFLVIVAIAAWIWGAFVQRGSKRKGLAIAIAAGLLIVGYGVSLEGELDWRTARAFTRGSATSLKHGKDGINWEPWSAAALEKARAEGRPVLVDFTADWCLVCQANKKSSIEIASVRQKLKEINALALLGDWTREDPAITAELKRFSRAGVPLVLVYPKDAGKEPEVLPALLTPAIVLEALNQAAR